MMIKRIFAIFKRDLKVNTKSFIPLYILLIPIIFGVLINVMTPGITDSPMTFAVLEEADTEQINFFEKFASIETFKTNTDLEKRVQKRDVIIGIGANDNLIVDGSEQDELIDYATLLMALYHDDADLSQSTTIIHDFNRTIPVLKVKLVNGALLMIAILGGMLISVNIVEEKSDNTLSAINITPTTRLTFLLGKSLIGVLFNVIGGIVLTLLTGFTSINFLQLIVILLITSLLTILTGIIQGLYNRDIMSAAGSIKLLFIPLIGGLLVYELLSLKWQKFMYWNPFYWAYKGNDLILSSRALWSDILFFSSITLLITGLISIVIIPKIRQGLEQQ